MKKINKAKLIIKLLVLTCALLIFTNVYVKCKSSDFLYSSLDSIPHNKVALLLGTSKYLSDGRENAYYSYRIEAVVALYNAGKVDYIVASGDNSQKDYDEPTDMKNDLVKRGVPAERIYLDYAGFRTLDSVVRCKAIFGQDSYTVVSQEFHNERAIVLARHNDIEAIGFNARDVDAWFGLKTALREYLARFKLVIDLVVGKEPKFLGEKVIIGEDSTGN